MPINPRVISRHRCQNLHHPHDRRVNLKKMLKLHIPLTPHRANIKKQQFQPAKEDLTPLQLPVPAINNNNK